MPELDSLIVEIDADWLKLGYSDTDDDVALLERTVYYEKKYVELENTYIVDVWFPVIIEVVSAATEAENDYFRVKYQLEGEAKDAESSCKEKP